MNPRYPLTMLQEILPNSDIKQVKDIRETMIKESDLYSSSDFIKALVLLSERLINISNESPRLRP